MFSCSNCNSKDLTVFMQNKAQSLVEDAKEGAGILDSFVLAKRVRIEMRLTKKGKDKPCFDFDKTWSTKASLLQILLGFLGTVAAIFALVCMRRIRKAEKRKAKEKLRRVKEEKRELIKKKEAKQAKN